MESEIKTSPVKENLICYHCGDKCPPAPVLAGNHAFCCEGCRLVYELLSENNLCTYYDYSKTPGHAAENISANTIYSSLDDKAIRSKLIQFENENMARIMFHVPGMHCSSCIWLLEHLGKLKKGIISSTVNFPRKEVTIDFEKDKVTISEIAILMASTGYSPAISLGDLSEKKERKRFNVRALKIGIAGFCFGNIMMLSFPDYFAGGDFGELPFLKHFFGWISLALSLPVLIYCASEFFISAWKTIRYKSLNIDAPIALAIAVTFSRSAFEIVSGNGSGYLDSMSGIVFFMLIGRYLQERTYDNLSFERDYKSYFPIAVAVKTETGESAVPVTNLKVGDRMIIRSGELIPADSILTEGEAEIDYSFVTGEIRTVKHALGDKIFAGGKQTTGVLEMIVTKATSQSYLTQLWNNDSFINRKVEKEKTYIDSINKWFSSAVILTSIIAFAAWMFIDKNSALNVFTAVLIVACPCTLLLAATFTNGSVLRYLGTSKFYLKNVGIINRIAESDTIVFDKTGTITCGSEATITFEGATLSAKENSALKKLTSQSGHPISRWISAKIGIQDFSPIISDFHEIKGKGISAKIGDELYMLGSPNYVGSIGDRANASEAWLAINGKPRGKFIIHNKYRDGFTELASVLKRKYQIELLSGDNDAEREKLAHVFGTKMRFNQSPQQKLDRIKAIQTQGKKVIMLGDGLNDAGALMQADAGIVVSDNLNNYFPACDAILDGSKFAKLPELIRFTKVAKRIVFVSFGVSLLYNIVGITIALQGILSPLIAAILMPASSFSVIILTTIAVRFSATKLKI